ncbi:MAG: hypothetical protein ACI977_000791 [Candidatus Nanohaloarchaea archaeon]|jgi:hypothetical protein
MQEVIDILTEDPERTTAMVYASASLTGLTYVGYQNDFGASGMTPKDLNNYLEEHSSDVGPVTLYKKHVYRKELEKREEEGEVLPDSV